MTVTRDCLSRLDTLPALLERARQRAIERGRPVLASLTIQLDNIDAGDLSFIAGPDAFLWEQPDRGLALHATGQALRIVAFGPQRFADTRVALQHHLDGAIVQGTGALPHQPIALAGFAFDPQRADNAAWFGYPDALIVVPRLLLARNGARVLLTANALVEAQDDVAAGAEDLTAAAARFLTPPPADDVVASQAHLLDPGPDARAYWHASVEGLTDGIARGDADKVVLARRVQVESDGSFELPAIIARLRLRYPDCTLFAVRSGDACFLGATPETLVALDGRNVRADCLAGTAPRGADADEDERRGAALLADDKERREHAFVTASIESALAELCSDVRHPAEPSLRKVANVQHLHTPITATSDAPRHILEFVERLHPTPATAGLPRERSLELIRVHEPFSRGWYAGPIGWIDADGGGEFAVALRSTLIRHEVASLYAGCGIVRGSDPEREFQESRMKLEAMLWALAAQS